MHAKNKIQAGKKSVHFSWEHLKFQCIMINMAVFWDGYASNTEKKRKKNEQQPNWKRYFKNWIAHYARLLLFCRSRNESASVVRIYSRKCQNNGTFRWFGNKTYGALRGSQLNTTEIWWLLVAQQMNNLYIWPTLSFGTENFERNTTHQ